MDKDRTVKDVLKDAFERELAREPERTMTPEELMALIEERKRNRTLPQRIRWSVSSWFLMRRVKKEMAREYGKGNW